MRDDVIEGGKLEYKDGAIAVPEWPGLGVRLDGEKLRAYSELYRELGTYPYDRDPQRPNWYALLPDTQWARPELLPAAEQR